MSDLGPCCLELQGSCFPGGHVCPVINLFPFHWDKAWKVGAIPVFSGWFTAHQATPISASLELSTPGAEGFHGLGSRAGHLGASPRPCLSAGL